MKKLIALLIASAVYSVSSLLAQSATPGASPAASPSPAAHKHLKKPAATPTTAASPAVSPSSSTGNTAKAVPSGTVAPGGGPGLVWVNSITHVYHKQGSRYYGTTKHGKYMTEADAIKEGDHAAKGETK